MSFIKNHFPLIFFVLFVAISCLALLFFQNKAINELKERNEAILSHYEKVLLLERPPKQDVSEIELHRIIEEFNLTPSQSMTLQIFIQELINETVQRSHVDLEVDSIVAAKSSTMYQETHDLLEMQFAKIQHESESLQIWCGLLTVVFLIFSFYSLFKTDELVQSGKESAKEMVAIKETGSRVIEDLRFKSRKSIDRFNSDAKSVLSDAKTSISDQKEELEEYLRATLKDSEGEFIDLSMQYLEGLDTKYKDLSDALKLEWDHYMKQIKESGIQDGNFKLIQEIVSRVEALENA